MRRLGWLLLAPALAANAAPEDDELFDYLLAPETSSTLTGQIGFSSDTQSLAIGYAYDSDRIGRISVNANRSDDSRRANGDATQWGANWDSRYFGDWSGGVGFSAWESVDTLKVRDYVVSLTWWGPQYSLQLKPGYRQITLDTRRDSRSEHAVSLGATARLRDLTIGYTGYDYSIDLDRLEAAIRNRRIRVPASFLDLIFSLEKRRFSVDYRVPLRQSDIGLRFDRSVSALDSQRLDWISGYVGFDISERWDGTFEIGRSAPEGDEAVAVATVGVGYHW